MLILGQVGEYLGKYRTSNFFILIKTISEVTAVSGKSKDQQQVSTSTKS